MARELLVVIATSGRAQLLARTLQSLAECALPENYRGTIVVENGEKCGAEDVVTRCDSSLGARYLYRAEANKSNALNAVLKETRQSLVVFLDDDVRVHPRTLQAYASAASGLESGCFFGGPVRVDYEVEPSEWLRAYFPGSARGWECSADQAAGGNIRFLGGNWAAFSEDLRAIGGFNPAKGPVSPTGAIGEDTEAQNALAARGRRAVYVPGAVVWHYVPRERSSEQWALARAYRQGVCEGMDSASDTAVKLFGLPRWALRRLCEDALRCCVTWFGSDHESRFAALRALRRSWGFIVGRQQVNRTR
jgi:GT2 family glycosyltransferase